MVELLAVLFSGTSLLLTFLIWINSQKVNIKANRWFSVFIFCIFLISLESTFIALHIEFINDFIKNILGLTEFIIAPIFFLSVSYFIEPNRKWRKRDYLHFLFASFILFLLLLVQISDSENSNDEISAEIIKNLVLIFSLFFGLIIITYCFLSYLKLQKHQKSIYYFSSSVEKIDLKWLQYLCIGVSIIAIFWIIDIIFNLSEANTFFDLFISSIYLFSVFFITYYWSIQNEIFPYAKIEKKEIATIIDETNENNTNRKKIIPEEKLNQIKADLVLMMKTKKPFLDCELNLFKLATEMNISSHILSYVINTGFEENFFQFVNRYRIEEAKKLIIDCTMDHLSILGIGYEVGFNSKTVFNTTFKKMTGKTPSQFKKSSSDL